MDKIAFLLAAMLVFLTACSSEQKEIEAYMDLVTKWNTEEFEIIKDYEEAYSDETTTKKEYLEILDKTLSRYPDFLKTAEAYRPQTEQLQTLHAIYTDSLRNYYESMVLDRAYGKPDQEDQAEMDKKFSSYLEESAMLAEKFESELEKTASMYNIELEWEEIQ
ncbi:hypothetical protein [Metabacillus sp. 84]|uniref:hypothetical protein n=1 Tax=unclassified Metabacillus TaxID=2675274 RepID=UPI003CE8C46D